MNRNIRREFASVIFIVITLIITMAWINHRNFIRQEYALDGVVREIDPERDEVIVSDGAGNTWGFYGSDNWKIGDVASMLMKDMGTADIYDDEIISVRYCGHIAGK